ncbi:MAG TPA: cytochrome c [Solirubrobacteraceae bacterium]
MSRPLKLLLIVGAALAIGALTSACGTEKIALAPSNPLYKGAVLFNQRCAGCHTLSYAATHGSAQFVRTKEYNNGPNFNVRCERPVTRVLYAIENGGFSGQIMPQNIVTGSDAVEVAKFVATYAGRQAPGVPGTVKCQTLQVGSIPAAATTAATATSTATSASNATTTTAATTTTSAAPKSGKHKARKSRHK